MQRTLFAALVVVSACDQGAKRTAPETGSALAPAPASAPARFAWMTDETAAFAQARAAGKAVVVELTARWATACTELDLLLADPQITSLLAPQFVPLRFDVTNDDDATAAIRERYRASTLPFVRFIDSDGTVLATITSLPSADELRATIEKAIAQRRPTANGSGTALRPVTACPAPDQTQLNTAIHAQQAAVAACVEQASAHGGASSVPSRFDATFEIDARGTVVTASVASPGGAVDHRLETCLIGMLLDLRFAPRSCPGTVTIRYPLVLDTVGE